MHGIVFNELRHYARARLGERGWDTLLQQAGLPKRIYLAFESYPDEEANALFSAASRATGRAHRAILEDFGEFIAPSLLSGYRALVNPEWSILELVENGERLRERVRSGPGGPSRLRCSRPRPDTVQVSYASGRRLCGVGIGLIRGLARELRQPVEVRESQCMLQGAPSCELHVRLLV